ncbi:ABC transporter permease subunit [Bisgaard Taxon 10/6]|uniref:ABC transporter permease subunit n=1 Tax=Exercitatus varius TaxID=67857 RepID=UPI00294B0219|nr:ABC transporter permease subunit [Exercitatus varius]MDG2954669.1 ABC transporter permease subunit [Exercitatus varius]
MLDKEPYEFRETERLRRIWLAFRRDRIALFSFYLFLLLILTALFSTFIAPYASDTQFIGKELTPPSWVASGEVAYFFGTDDLGRDVFSRIINGVSYTFGSALIVVIFTAFIGGGLGILAGMSHGFKSRVLGHFLDTFLSVPILLISIVIATLMEPGLSNAMLAISLALLPHFIHEIYQAIQQELKKDYILTMRLDGAPNRVLLRETILPNIMVRYIREIVQAFVIALLEISSLSFISLGAQRPTPEWGAMIRDSLELIYIAPWAVILPGIAIIFVLLIVILMGNGICRTLERYGE